MARLSSWISIACFVILAVSYANHVSAQSSKPAPVSEDEYHLNGGEGSLRPEECSAACEYRCSATSHKEPCLFFCNMCCKKCLCVPSGTYGHKEECPCYNDWKTQEGGPKCP